MKYKRDNYELSTGKAFYSNAGIIGIANDLEISEGYDEGIYEDFTLEEKEEIANYMIDLWNKYKSK